MSPKSSELDGEIMSSKVDTRKEMGPPWDHNVSRAQEGVHFWGFNMSSKVDILSFHRLVEDRHVIFGGGRKPSILQGRRRGSKKRELKRTFGMECALNKSVEKRKKEDFRLAFRRKVE